MLAGSTLVRNRINAAVVFLILAGVALLLQLVHLQVFRHGYYLGRAQRVQAREMQRFALRGAITDRNGLPLAISTTARCVYADPGLLHSEHHRRAVAHAVAPLLGMTEGVLLARLHEPGRFEVLAHKVSEQTSNEIEKRMRALAKRFQGDQPKFNRRSIAAMPEPVRLYPRGALACHVLGFVGRERRGGAGIEAAYDRVLRGRDGRVLADVDALGKIIPGRRFEEEEPVPGGSVRLTIDATIQEAAERALARAVQQTHAAGGTVAVADPASGEILALANCPVYDPNQYQRFSPDCWNNRAVTSPYEPGSTFKLVAAAAALEDRVVAPGEIAVHCSGALRVGNHTLHCVMHGKSGGHGASDICRILVKSCNVGAATLGLRLGRKTLYEYVRRFGFGSRVGLGLGGETPGIVADLADWRSITTANVAFGQGISVTPLQMLAAYCAVANGGVLPRLHVVSSVRQGDRLECYAPSGKRIISEHTAALLRQYLAKVTEQGGTGTLAAIEGYRVAGKTGTAQKAPYHSGKCVGSFVGFLPAEKPRLAIIAVIDEPKGSHYGGVVAAPVFQEVAKQAIAYLKVPPPGLQPVPATRPAAAPALPPLPRAAG